MKWAVGGWTFFIAENVLISENRDYLRSALRGADGSAEDGDFRYHALYGPISTAACIHLATATANFAWLEDRSTESGFQWVHGRPFTKYPQRAGLTPGPPPALSASALRLL